jgi:hypothetical protein
MSQIQQWMNEPTETDVDAPSFLTPVSKTTLREISNLELNDDVLNVIKSYCYHKYNDALIINRTKFYKKMTNFLILEAMSRTTHSFENHWAFGFPWDHPTERLQLQTENCGLCGNYTDVSNDSNLFSHQIFCRCNLNA